MASARNNILPLFNRLYSSRILATHPALYCILQNGHSSNTNDEGKILQNPSRVLSRRGFSKYGTRPNLSKKKFSKSPMKSAPKMVSPIGKINDTNLNNTTADGGASKWKMQYATLVSSMKGYCNLGKISELRKKLFSRVSKRSAKKRVIEDEILDDKYVVYEGPYGEMLRRAKWLSLAGVYLSMTAAPSLIFVMNPDKDFDEKGMTALSIILLAASFYKGLNWVFDPYVRRLKWKPSSETFQVEVLTWLGTVVTDTIKFSEIGPPDRRRPLASFKAGKLNYYIDKKRFPDKVLLTRLIRR